RVKGTLQLYQSEMAIELNVFDHAKRLTDQYFQSNISSGHISSNTYNYRDELTRKKLGVGVSDLALQTLDYSYNKRGWLKRINHPLPSVSDEAIAACEPLPEVNGDCNNAPQVNLEELLQIRLTDEPINLDCYQDCEGWSLPGMVFTCDRIARFVVNFISRIHEIEVDGQLVSLPNAPYDLVLDSTGHYHFGSLTTDLYSWLLQNNYQVDSVTTVFDSSGQCLMDLIIHNTNAASVNMLGGNNPLFTSWCTFSGNGYIFQFPNNLTWGYEGNPGAYAYPYSFFRENCQYTRLQSPPSASIDASDYPVKVYEIELDNGEEYIFTEEELGQYGRAYAILQCQTFQDAQQSIDVLSDGKLTPVTLLQLLDLRHGAPVSFVQSDTCTPPASPTCQVDRIAKPNGVTGLVFYDSTQVAYNHFNFTTYQVQNGNERMLPYEVSNEEQTRLQSNHIGEYEWDLGLVLNESPELEILAYQVHLDVRDACPGQQNLTIGIHDGQSFLSFNGGRLSEVIYNNTPLNGLQLLLDSIPSVEQVRNMKVIVFNHCSANIGVHGKVTVREACSPDCPIALPAVTCSAEEIAFQLSSIEAIRAAATLEVDSLPMPNNLLRVLLCDGTAVYLFEHELAILQGNYEIVQWIGVSNTTQTFAMTPQGETTLDAFAMRLYYQENIPGAELDGIPQKNGNISNISWQSRGRQIQRYGFSYDDLDRLTGAIYKDRLPDATWATDNKYTVSNITYDKNGNLKTLARQGLIQPCPGTPQYGFVDILNYGQYQGNQVGQITDAAPLEGGVKANVNNLFYDASGNLAAHSGKNISSIIYNHLNLPNEIRFNQGQQQIEWIYDATGRKWGKIVKENGAIVSRKDYIGEIEYTDGQLEAIYHSEGRVSVELGMEYVIRDHLGNSRVHFSDLNQNGRLEFYGDKKEVIQEEHYYPFGMNMEGEWASQIGPNNKYQYNDKEFNEEFGLNWNDYGMRWYDPVIARWSHIDPLAEGFNNWSPYCYGKNNPILNIDPSGAATYSYNWETGNYEDENDEEVSWEMVQQSLVKNDIIIDENGEIVFEEDGEKEIGYYDANNMTVVQFGYIFTDDGTRIEVSKNDASDVFPGFDCNCHGLSFGGGKYWIGNNQVEKILKGDNYEEVRDN
ncbi:MAG: RHS repeat-associated core domain-containing protein, partial [Bacteroidota bacterium]